MSSQDLVLFIKENVPKDVKSMTTFADQYREARGLVLLHFSAAYGSSRTAQVTRSKTNHGKGSSIGRNKISANIVSLQLE